MTQPLPGVTATTTVSVTDWEALGDAIAGASSDDQAALLAGFCCGLAPRQDAYIADAITQGNARESILDVLDALASLIRSTP